MLFSYFLLIIQALYAKFERKRGEGLGKINEQVEEIDENERGGS